MYEGTWVNGVMKGPAKVTYDNKDLYVGGLDKGHSRQGYGVMTYCYGDVYEGMWGKSRYHGKGEYTKACGTVIEGVWRKGVFYK